jgi:acyl-CoA thioester hydrolase
VYRWRRSAHRPAKDHILNDIVASKPAHRPAAKLADYPHRITEIVRFGDLDPQGHVNQAVFLTYFESGRVAMFRSPDLGIGVPGFTFVMVRMEVDYVKELHWPGTIEVGTGVAEFGRSSFKVTQAIFRDGACCAIGRATLVCMDLTTRRSAPLPEAALERLNPWKYRGG